MKTLFTNSLLLLFFLKFLNVSGQKAQEQNQIYDLGATINQMTLTVGGVLVVATNDGLTGINPSESKPIFTFNDFGSLKPEETEFIPLSPYIVVSQGATGAFAGLGKTKRAVIDYVSGNVLFQSDKMEWNQIYTCNVILPDNKLVISGLQKTGSSAEKMTPRVAVYNLASGKEEFQFFLDKPGRVGIAKNFSVTGTPLLLKNSLLIPTAQGVISMSKTGEQIWKNDVKNIYKLTVDNSETEIYGFESANNGKNTRIHKFGTNNGAELWKNDRKVKGVITRFQILDQGIIIVSDAVGNTSSGTMNKLFAAKEESDIALLSATNGEDIWEKAPKTKGYVQHFYVLEDGILFGIQSGGINKIAFDGTPLFKKPLKTGENILTMAQTDQGLLYITSEDANIVNLNDGETVWSKPLKYKKATAVASTFDKTNNRYLIVADGKLVSIDAKSGDISDFAKVDFDEKEDPTSIQIREKGIYLGATQNMSLLNFDGSKNYHTYYKSPGRSTFGKIIGGVMAVTTTALAASMSARAGANRTGSGGIDNLDSYNDYGKEAKRAADMFSNIASASFSYMSKRFSATSASENSQFMLTNLNGGAGLVKVNKDTGKVDKEILLKDKKPEYEVDEQAGFLFYKADKKTIYVYNLNK